MGIVVGDITIRHGSFCVVPRTDGAFGLVDTRRPIGDRTVEVFRILDYVGFNFDVTEGRDAARKRCEAAAEEACKR